MSFKKISLTDLRKNFGVPNKVVSLFEGVEIQPIEPSIQLQSQLANAAGLPLKSEKARSEFFVAPVLLELRNITDQFFTIYSGEMLEADAEKGLTGECDFILAKSDQSYDIHLPIISVVEAKRENLDMGVQQCAAQLYGAYVFNKKSGIELDTIYGCVTTADNWQFMALKNGVIEIDKRIYFKVELNLILGIFNHIIEYYQKRLS